MSNECDRFGLEDSECRCYLQELEERITALEEGLDQLTDIFESMSEFIKRNVDERRV